MKSRFNVFSVKERDYIRLALRSFANLYFDDISDSDSSRDKYCTACALLYELFLSDFSGNSST